MKPFSFFAAATLAAGTLTFAGSLEARAPALAATPPPTPPPIGTPASPVPERHVRSRCRAKVRAVAQPAAERSQRHRRRLGGPDPASQRHGLHAFKLTQQGDALTGTYLDTRGKRYPLAGMVDGSAVRLIVSMPNGTTLLLEGKLDGTTDMIGMLTMTEGQVPFTASYRPKEKWIENVNPSPGGIPSSNGGYTPP